MRINNTASVSLLNGSEENVGKVARSIVHAFDLNEISAPGCEQPVMSRGRKLCTLLELTLPFLSLSIVTREDIYSQRYFRRIEKTFRSFSMRNRSTKRFNWFDLRLDVWNNRSNPSDDVERVRRCFPFLDVYASSKCLPFVIPLVALRRALEANADSTKFVPSFDTYFRLVRFSFIDRLRK